MASDTKSFLREEYFRRIPKARKRNPVFEGIFELMHDAHLAAGPGTRLLNIYSSHDFSGNREEVYRERFFKECEYETIDFWEDSFIYNNVPVKGKHYFPFPDNHFDVVVTTKIILEHISEPEVVVKELHRILKPGGKAFIIAPLVRRQHQKPHDYYRYTEFLLEYLFKKAGFSQFSAVPTNGGIYTLASYAYFFQRVLPMPKVIEKCFDFFHYWVIEPVAYFLDRFDNGYGRDMSLYFLIRSTK